MKISVVKYLRTLNYDTTALSKNRYLSFWSLYLDFRAGYPFNNGLNTSTNILLVINQVSLKVRWRLIVAKSTRERLNQILSIIDYL